MRALAVIAAVVLSGCLLPTNEISGSWSVGGPDGCMEGDVINVMAPGVYGDEDRPIKCTARTFSVQVPDDLYEFAVVFDVWPLVERGVDRGATVELTRVIDDFNIGLVHFATIEP